MDVWELTSNFIAQFDGHVIIYPYWYILVKGPQMASFFFTHAIASSPSRTMWSAKDYMGRFGFSRRMKSIICSIAMFRGGVPRIAICVMDLDRHWHLYSIAHNRHRAKYWECAICISNCCFLLFMGQYKSIQHYFNLYLPSKEPSRYIPCSLLATYS